MVQGTQKLLLVACLLLLALGLPGGCSDEGDYNSEGTANDPRDLGTAPTIPHEGSVSGEANSYYFAKITEIKTYIVSMSQLVDDADLAVFEDKTFTSPFCASVNNGTTSESCSATPSTTGELYIQVKPIGDNGTSYLISVQ